MDLRDRSNLQPALLAARLVITTCSRTCWLLISLRLAAHNSQINQHSIPWVSGLIVVRDPSHRPGSSVATTSLTFATLSYSLADPLRQPTLSPCCVAQPSAG